MVLKISELKKGKVTLLQLTSGGDLDQKTDATLMSVHCPPTRTSEGH